MVNCLAATANQITDNVYILSRVESGLSPPFVVLTGYRGPPQGYAKYLEHRLHFYEFIICQVSSASPSIAKEFEDALQSISTGSPLSVSEMDVDAWRSNSPVANLLARLSATQSQPLQENPSPVVSRDPPPNDSGIFEVDEHSVIRYLGPTSGLHLMSQASLSYFPSLFR